MEVTHVPVLLQEVIEYLEPAPGKFIVDGTADGGGHALEILKRIPGGRLLALEWDPEMAERLRRKFEEEAPDARWEVVNDSYANLRDVLEARNLPKPDGLLLDLGFSSEQLDGSGRGFAFKNDEPLLMTYDPERTPVKSLLKQLRESELADIIYEFSGERYARRIAKAIKDASRKRTITTSGELAEIIRKAVPGNYERGRIDAATRTFQALRIYANDELGNLARVLRDLPEVMAPAGRAAVISFHSLEDKLVKEKFRELKKEGLFEIVTPKPVEASGREIAGNPRSRSAKLRVAKKTV